MPDRPNPASAWRAVLGRLQLEMPREHFNTFLQPCVGHAWEGDDLVVAAANSFVVSWLELPLHLAMAQEALTRTLGREAGIQYRPLPAVAQTTAGAEPNATVSAITAAPEMARTPIPSDYDLGSRGGSSGGYDWTEANSATCNPVYSFANFVVGQSNQLAYHAASAVVNDDGRTAGGYNPLFFYAGPGLGKTHLLHAIGNRALQQNRSTLYVTSEQFTNEFVSAINGRAMRQFRDRYRNLDVLLMDDVQFLIGKEQTQESLFHTFNDLHQAGAQIVLTSDRSPQSINPLEDRLRSRFQCGLLADIQPPSLETRIAILHAWSSQQDEAVSDDILELIAHRVNRNVRELRGAFNRIIAMSQLMSMPMTVENVTHQLDAIAGPNTRRHLTPEQVLNQAALHYGITVEQILGRGRIASVAEARQIVMYLLTAELGITPTDAGRFLSGRNHSTVIHGSNKIRAAIATDDRIGRSVSSIKDALYS